MASICIKIFALQIELHTCLNLFEPSGHVNTYIDQHVTVIRIVQGCSRSVQKIASCQSYQLLIYVSPSLSEFKLNFTPNCFLATNRHSMRSFTNTLPGSGRVPTDPISIGVKSLYRLIFVTRPNQRWALMAANTELYKSQ